MTQQELADQEIDRMRKHHRGEMYGCVTCYRSGPYYGGPPCPTRALIDEYDRLRAEEAQEME